MTIASVVTAETASGTIERHGSPFLFRRNDLTQARDPFAQTIRDPIAGKFIPDTLWNQFAGALRGPIIEIKGFLFGAFLQMASATTLWHRTSGPLIAAGSTSEATIGSLKSSRGPWTPWSRAMLPEEKVKWGIRREGDRPNDHVDRADDTGRHDPDFRRGASPDDCWA